jgi:DNA-binding transcriptional LysR family regulator
MLIRMTLPAGLDPDLLRAFAYIAEEGSFTRAAERVGRTQSAVSMQVQRLESVLGQKLLLRGKGGSVRLTSHGRFLLERSRALLALNDEIWSSFRSPQVHGTVRLGTPDDYALRYLPQVLKRFADSHPAVEVDVLCAPSEVVLAQVKAGELDLSLCSGGYDLGTLPSAELWRGPLRWITSDRHAPHRQDPLPLALAGENCCWRAATLRTLEQAGRRWRVAYTSATLAGTIAPVLAGLAVSVATDSWATDSWLPNGLRLLRSDEGLPGLPNTSIMLAKSLGARQPVTDVLAAHIADTFSQDIRRQEWAA